MLLKAQKYEQLRARIMWYAQQHDFENEIKILQPDDVDHLIDEVIGYLWQGQKTIDSLIDRDMLTYGTLMLHKAILELCWDAAVHHARWYTLSAQNASITKGERFAHYMQIIGQLEQSVQYDLHRFNLDISVDAIQEMTFDRVRPGRNDKIGGPYGFTPSGT